MNDKIPLELLNIPQEVYEAERIISDWMKENAYSSWIFGRIMDANPNTIMARDILFEDPLTGEELRPSKAPYCEGANLILEVENESGEQKWKHTILTEEI